MNDTYNNTLEYADSTTNEIATDAALLGDGTNRDIFNNIERLESFQEKIISVLHTDDQDWALRTVMDIFPNTHTAAVAFFKSSEKGQEIYRNIASFIKTCFMNMKLNANNLELYRSLLSFYYSEKTTITMLPAKKQDFYRMEFEDCEKDYEKIDTLEHKIDKLKIAYRMQEIVSRIKVHISKHMVTQKIDQINREVDLNEELAGQIKERGTIIGNPYLPPGYDHFSRFFFAFLKDHPDIGRNVFLMMRFKTGIQYDEIHAAIQDQLKPYGLSVLRADDKDYTGDLWENVCLYMLGSSYGVAVFEEIDSREFNPSVALELGFMLAHNKRCLILKDRRMSQMPTDIVGKLYKEFDTYRITETVEVALKSWVHDIEIA